MKIKFIKEYRAIPLSGGIDNDWGCYKDEVKDVHDDQGQWLIDNGFAEEVKSGWWKPKPNESYYFLGTIGEAGAIPWYNDKLDKYRYSVGNCFKTKDAAERYRDYLKAIAAVRQDEGVLTPEQVNERIKNEDLAYYVGYMGNRGNEEVLCGCTMSFEDCWAPVGAILFDSEVHADRSLDKHPDEWRTIANYDWSRE